MTPKINEAIDRLGLPNLLLPIVAVLVMVGMVPAAAAKSAQQDLFYIGSQGNDVRAARFDPRDGTLTAVGPVMQASRPTWTLRHPTLPVLYVGNADPANGTVIASRIDAGTAALTKLNDVSAGGGGTTHLWFDQPSMTLLAANYASGSLAAIPVNRDGSLGAFASLAKTSGTGPSPRQTSPHAHGVTVDPSGKFALVADLGADRVFVFPFDRRTRQLGASTFQYVGAAGSGPRHLVFGPGGRTLYLVSELTAEVTVLAWDSSAGRLTEVQKLSTDAPGYTGTRSAAELGFSRDGRFLYVSNRSDSAMLVYAVDRPTGRLTQIQRLRTGGELPWAFALHRSGRWMLVAHQKSERIDALAVDPRTGMLSPTDKWVASPKPVSITFAN